jgi:hypothetical protein
MNKNQKVLRTTIIVTIISCFFFDNSYFLWVKFDGMWLALSGALWLISFSWLIIATTLLVIRIARYSAWRKLSGYLFLGFSILYLLCVLFIPFRPVNENTFQSPVKISCCYEGTMNTSWLYFRENSRFEDYNIGFFARVHTLKGTYTQKSDTLFLSFAKGKPRLLGDTLVIRDSVVYKVQGDTLAHTFYYLGRCKGLN